jgi:hypothetical protein
MSEAQLLRRARQGDEDAFSQLFARHERAVCRYAAYMCGLDAGDDMEFRLINLRRGEPSGDLFTVPSDYTVVDAPPLPPAAPPPPGP